MLRGLTGQNLIRHFSLPTPSSLILRPGTEMQVGMTRLLLPSGFPGPTPRVPSEKAFAVSVHLRRPGIVKGWGSWIDGRFREVSYWDLGGIEIFDMESDPIGLRKSGFDSVHIHIPRSTLNRYTDLSGLRRIGSLLATPGVRDDVILHWTQSMLPFFNKTLHLPELVIDHLTMVLCAHLAHTYRDDKQPAQVVSGGLATWQQERAIALLRENLDGNIGYEQIAVECGLSPSQFARAFRKTFGMSAHRYLILLRIDIAKALLLHSHKQLLEIAMEAGFSDQSAFNRCFRAFVGASPGQWRRQNRSDRVSVAWSTPTATVH